MLMQMKAEILRKVTLIIENFTFLQSIIDRITRQKFIKDIEDLMYYQLT